MNNEEDTCEQESKATAAALYGKGLSPRVRGNQCRQKASTWRLRSIPACTGEPAACRPTPPCCGVYPRVYGGTLFPDVLIHDLVGLSPRVWGNQPYTPAVLSGSGSIPACTGEPL